LIASPPASIFTRSEGWCGSAISTLLPAASTMSPFSAVMSPVFSTSVAIRISGPPWF
jgi:hypothetical protein